MKRILPLTAVVVALVGCAKPSVTPTDDQASAKADPQVGEPNPKSDTAEPTSKSAEKNIPAEAARAAQSVNEDKSKSEQAEMAYKSKQEYARIVGAEIVSGMKEDDFLRKNPSASKRNMRPNLERSVSIYSAQNTAHNCYPIEYCFFDGSLVGLRITWKPNSDDYTKRHRDIIETMGQTDYGETHIVPRRPWDHVSSPVDHCKCSWLVADIGLFIEYESSLFMGLSQSITICSVAGVGRDVGLLGFHKTFEEHFNAVAIAKPSPSKVGSEDKEKLDYIKKLSPEVVGGYSLDELYKAHADTRTIKPTKNLDGSQELIWGDNLVNKQAMIGDGKVLLYRVKVIRADRPAAEKEASRPTATLGKPKSTSVPDDEPDTVSCNVWIEQGYWVRTAVVKGKTVKNGDVYFAETFVINLKGIDSLRKK